LGAQLPLRADRKHVAHKQHPDHQHRIDRRPTRMRVIGRKLLVYPIQIENAVNLPDQMIRRYHLVEIKPVEELTLSALSPPHHRPLPANRSADPRNHGPTAVSTRVLQHYRGHNRHWAAARNRSKVTRSVRAGRRFLSSVTPTPQTGPLTLRYRAQCVYP